MTNSEDELDREDKNLLRKNVLPIEKLERLAKNLDLTDGQFSDVSLADDFILTSHSVIFVLVTAEIFFLAAERALSTNRARRTVLSPVGILAGKRSRKCDKKKTGIGFVDGRRAAACDRNQMTLIISVFPVCN